jgi:hypothetical protein
VSAVGVIPIRRRYWQCRCGREGSYAVDAVLGIEGRFSKTVQKHCCRLGSDFGFAATTEHMQEMLGVSVCPETVRTLVEGHGRAMATFQPKDTQTGEAFAKAAGEVEFAVDAGKVNTREDGWKDLKIAVISKREAGEPTALAKWDKQRLPAATMVMAFAMIATAKTFRRSWRKRLRGLGVTCMAGVQALGDGAGWIWKSVERALTGCTQTLDCYHACEHLHHCAEGIFGEGSVEAQTAFEHSRGLLLLQGWAGICQWAGELLSVDGDPERERRRRWTDKLIGYFSKHINRLNYAERLAAGRAIGSGVVEGQAKTLGLRLKRRGARWNRRNVQPMASLVCVRHSAQWTAYWNQAV